MSKSRRRKRGGVPQGKVAFASAPVFTHAMDFLLKGLEKTTHWRIYCRAVEHGRSLNDEILSILNAGSVDVVPDAEARLSAARGIRAKISAQQTSP